MTCGANAIPDTRLPTNPVLRSIVPTTLRFATSKRTNPAGVPSHNSPPWFQRCSIVPDGRPSMVVIGSSHACELMFHTPSPPQVATQIRLS